MDTIQYEYKVITILIKIIHTLQYKIIVKVNDTLYYITFAVELLYVPMDINVKEGIKILQNSNLLN